MSTVTFLNEHSRRVREKASGYGGVLLIHDRLNERGKNQTKRVVRTYEAIFTYDESLFCTLADVPLRAGYYVTPEGQAEVVQLFGMFNTNEDRAYWIDEQFEQTYEKHE